jgi:hypothetical protein
MLYRADGEHFRAHGARYTQHRCATDAVEFEQEPVQFAAHYPRS